MTIEEYLSLSIGSLLYNKEHGAFCKVNYPYPADKNEIPTIIAKLLSGDIMVLTGGVNCGYYVTESSDLRSQDPSFTAISIPPQDRDWWQCIQSICEIDNQKLVNKILMAEIRALKSHLMAPQDIEIYMPPPQKPVVNIPGRLISSDIK